MGHCGCFVRNDSTRLARSRGAPRVGQGGPGECREAQRWEPRSSLVRARTNLTAMKRWIAPPLSTERDFTNDPFSFLVSISTIMDKCLPLFLSLRYFSTTDMRRDVQEIFRATPHHKQVMMFSATLSKDIRATCKKFMQSVSKSNAFQFRANVSLSKSTSTTRPS